MTRFEAFRHVVLLPALGKVWPALSSQIIIVMLGSAVCSQIATEELSFAANFIQSRNFRAFETYLLTTLVYLCMALMIRQLLNWIGRRFVMRNQPMSGFFLLGNMVRNLLTGLQWTLLLSLVAFVGGGLIGLLVMTLRISSKAFRTQSGPHLYRTVPGHAAAHAAVPGVFRHRAAGGGHLALAGSGDCPDTCLPAPTSLRSGAVVSTPSPTGQWEASASLALNPLEQLRYVILPQALRIAGGADGGVLGAGGQRHRRDLHHRLHRIDQDRRHARQRHLRALHGLRPGGPRLLPALLPLVPQCALPGKETACLCLEFPPCISITAITTYSRAST